MPLLPGICEEQQNALLGKLGKLCNTENITESSQRFLRALLPDNDEDPKKRLANYYHRYPFHSYRSAQFQHILI